MKPTTRTESLLAASAAVERAAHLGYTKPLDIAVAVLGDLERAGFRIVRKPTTPKE